MSILQKKTHVDGTPTVDQHCIGGLSLTWNPDDDKFYIETGGHEALGRFTEYRNAVQFLKRKAKERR